MDHPFNQTALHDPQKLIIVADKIGQWCIQRHIQAIAGRGVSGIVPAAVVSAAYGLDLIIVRKPREDKHTTLNAQGPLKEVESYVIVDDLIDSGLTIRRIIAAMGNRQPEAILLYCVQNPAPFDNIPVVAVTPTEDHLSEVD
jgi:adenine/guanine phosphoribosyltransferase-like PRPP-binding protein